MLTVGPRKQRALATESSFEGAFAKAILPRRSWHMSCIDKGWPDRFVTGGIWIEFKVLDGWADQLKPEQKVKLTELARAGNPVFYCALTQDHEVIFEPWLAVRGKFLKVVRKHKYRTGKDLKEIFDGALQEFLKSGRPFHGDGALLLSDGERYGRQDTDRGGSGGPEEQGGVGQDE